jgi:Rps23 Pro-64 3,4-dihydroxylase Tpa1-like proline 4-hydroxylase
MPDKLISSKYEEPTSLTERYLSNNPFPHIVLDDFLSEDLMESVAAEFPDLSSLPDSKEYANQKEIKFSSIGSPRLSPSAKQLINYLNSDVFLEYLQNLTGIKETLISDPYLSGGGYHEIKTGGVLKVHADFNKHPKLDLDRRLNLLLYLNKDWDAKWCGNLELYDQDNLDSPVVSIEPIFNRCVIFTTTDFTYHGHPEKLTCPSDTSRRSIALYYFSTGRPSHEISGKKHTTLFIETKGEKFKADFKGLIRDFIPPIIIKAVKRTLGR